MTTFFWKCSALVALLFLGVLIGMQLVTSEMKQMAGGETNKVAVRQDKGISAPEKLTIHHLNEKKQEMNNIKSFDLFSKTGDTITGVIQSGFQATVDGVLERVKNMLVQVGGSKP